MRKWNDEKIIEELNYKMTRKPFNYWNEETIVKELNSVISQLKHFPTWDELLLMKRYDLARTLSKNGGFTKFRKIMGYDLLQNLHRKWTDEDIIRELKLIIKNDNHFPTDIELRKIKMRNLSNAIAKHGGINKFRKLLGYDLPKRPNGYWTDELIVSELRNIINKCGYFPSQEELMSMDRNDILGAIANNGGFLKFHNLLGYVSIQEKYKSELCSYTHRRGKSSEKIIKQILLDYCSLHSLPKPLFDKKLSKGHVLEFVCNTNKTIGIDVTNTEKHHCITNKYKKKSYHKYLDELWIVVFSDKFKDSDYQKWNIESPSNVKVFSIYQFLKELDYSLDESLKQKVDKYCSCTFHSKDELKNNTQQMRLFENTIVIQ